MKRLLFLMILATAAFLRLAWLDHEGIFGVDDGRYLLDGLSKQYEFQVIGGLLEGKGLELAGKRNFLLGEYFPAAAGALAREHPFSPKLGFTYLTAAMLAATGFSVSACNYLEAAAGTFLVALLAFYVRRVRDSTTGLLAAALTAVSGYAVYFSRDSYAQFTPLLPMLLAVWAHLRWYDCGRCTSGGKTGDSLGKWHWLFICGALAGVSFWVNYQAAGALPLLVAVHVAACTRAGSLKSGFKVFFGGGTLMALGFACVMGLAEGVTYPMILLFRSQGMTYPHGTFLELLWPRLVSQSGAPFNFSGLLLFPFFLGLLDGYAALSAWVILLVLGVALTFRGKRPDSGSSAGRFRTFVYLGLPFAVPFLVFSLKTMQGARMFTYALPFFFGLVATAAVSVWRGYRSGGNRVRFVVATALAVAAISSALHLREILAIRSAYPEFMAYLKTADSPAACAAWSSVLEAYLLQDGLKGGSVYTFLGRGAAPPRYYTSDWQELYDRRYPDEAVALPPGARPFMELRHRFGRIFLEVEAFPSFGNTLDSIRWVGSLDLDRARKLLVYDLRQTGLRAGLAAPVTRENR